MDRVCLPTGWPGRLDDSSGRSSSTATKNFSLLATNRTETATSVNKSDYFHLLPARDDLLLTARHGAIIPTLMNAISNRDRKIEQQKDVFIPR